jgi:glycosyltransferase involved in cell wall biosynthesis
MIVKNEKPVILKCLESVKPYIDYWVIVDTGSTDGTQEAISKFMKDIPGELHVRPWVNFAHNRNEALELGREKGDYCLFIDADEILVVPKSFQWPQLKSDLYAVTVHQTHPQGGTSSALRAFLMKSKFDGKFVGVLHETIHANSPYSTEILPDICIQTDASSGHRSQDPNKYLNDANVLKKALESEPNNDRYQFYLANSYALAGKLELALETFEKHAQMKSVDCDQCARSLLQIGMIQEHLHKAPAIFLSSYEKAFRYCPQRAEPLYCIANYHLSQANYEKAYGYFKQVIEIPLPTSSSFVEPIAYSWLPLYNLAICAQELKKSQETQKILKKLLLRQDVPAPQRQVAEQVLKEVL